MKSTKANIRPKKLSALLCVLTLTIGIIQPILAKEVRKYPAYDRYVPYKMEQPPYHHDEKLKALRANLNVPKVIVNHTDVVEIPKETMRRKAYVNAVGDYASNRMTTLINLETIAPFINVEYKVDLANKKFYMTGYSHRYEKNITIVGKAGEKHVTRDKQQIPIDPVHPDLKIELVDGKFYIPIIMIYQTFGYFATYDGMFNIIYISDMKIDRSKILTRYSDYNNPAKAVWEGMPQLDPVQVSKYDKTDLGESYDRATANFYGPPMGYAGVVVQSKNDAIVEILVSQMVDFHYGSVPTNYYESEKNLMKIKELLCFYLGSYEGLIAFYKYTDYCFGIMGSGDFKTVVFPSGRKMKIEYNYFPVLSIY